MINYPNYWYRIYDGAYQVPPPHQYLPPGIAPGIGVPVPPGMFPPGLFVPGATTYYTPVAPDALLSPYSLYSTKFPILPIPQGILPSGLEGHMLTTPIYQTIYPGIYHPQYQPPPTTIE
jgi:hypothetical protein